GGAPRRDQIKALIEKHNSRAPPASTTGAPVGTRGLEVPRRRQTPPSIGPYAVVLMGALGLSAPPAAAQIAAAPDFPLLAPSLDGNPQKPPVFRKASPQTAGAATAPAGQSSNF